jgi:hypothetical protein
MRTQAKLMPIAKLTKSTRISKREVRAELGRVPLLRERHAPREESYPQMQRRHDAELNVGRPCYFHKVWGKTKTNEGIARETCTFLIDDVSVGRDGEPQYVVSCDAEGPEYPQYVVPVDDITVMEDEANHKFESDDTGRNAKCNACGCTARHTNHDAYRA